MPSPNQETVEDLYLTAHMECMSLAAKVQKLIQDMPAPGNDDHPIEWEHVGKAEEVENRLAGIVAFLEGKER